MTQRLISHREILETTREQLSALPAWCRGQKAPQTKEAGVQNLRPNEKPVLAAPKTESK